MAVAVYCDCDDLFASPYPQVVYFRNRENSMTKDQIAIYLNEHPEFFNDYPELLEKIKSIQPSDLPLEPLGTLSIADRILKRVHDDKEHLKSQFEWIMEIVKTNENIQGQLYEIERLVLSSTHLPQMLHQLQRELAERFSIEHVVVCLVDYSEHLIEHKLQERFGKDLDGILVFVNQDTVSSWFGKDLKPVLRSEINGNSVIFGGEEYQGKVNSEALLPLILRGGVVGAIGLGCSKPFRFYPELRTEYLERLTDKLALVIDNMLLLDLLKRQPLIDSETGFYSQAFLEPILLREFDRAQRYEKPLICVKMRIDYFTDLVNTYNESGGSPEVGKILKDNFRVSDVVIRSIPRDSKAEASPNIIKAEEFIILFPEISRQDAVKVAERICRTLEIARFIVDGKAANVIANIGVVAYPENKVSSHAELLDTVSQELAQAIKIRKSPTTLAG